MNAATAALSAIRREPSTPHQRLYIRTMFGQLDLDTRFTTRAHRRFFTAAQLVVPRDGANLDAELCSLSRRQASALIEALRAEVPSDA